VSGSTSRPSSPRLRVEASLAFATAATAVVAGATLLDAEATRSAAVLWAGATGLVLAGELAYLLANLETNRVDGGPLRGSLGLANGVTLFRGGLYAVTAGFAVVAPVAAVAWLPALCYGTGAALDWIDGALARAVGRTSRLGAKLDLAFDTLGFVVAPLVAAAWGRLPVWYLALSAARFVFKAGVAWRRRRGLAVGDLPASRVRRPLAGFQMAFLTLALAPVLPSDVLFAVAPLALAPSLVIFARDYLAVSGRLGGVTS
jgi:CDP-diacylglycerol--glycerol-3-phosphate 3-phosphatidyltransferase